MSLFAMILLIVLALLAIGVGIAQFIEWGGK